MQIQILGSAAGGGFPQWNCNCINCSGLRNGTLKAKARTQSSIAISSDGIDWVLINTSPDILAQISAFPALQPARAKRDTGISSIILMDSQIDHCTGLLMLREGCPHQVWCTPEVKHDLSNGFPLFTMLDHWNGGLQWNPINLQNGRCSFQIEKFPSLRFTAIPLSSSAPPYSPHRNDPHVGDNIGLIIEDIDSGKSLFYAPGLGEIEPHLTTIMSNSDCLLVDGTLWRDDEMLTSGVGDKLGITMGHMAQSGKGGMIEFLDTLDKPRKILIHINNTNPILDEESEQRKQLESHQIEVAFDGMSIEL